MSSSDSSDDENENMKMLLQAVDTNFINDQMFTEDEASKQNQEKPKSQRYLDNSEPLFQSEINVTEAMQNHFMKKLNQLVSDQVNFVQGSEPEDDQKFPKIKKIKLFGSGKVLKLEQITMTDKNPNLDRKKPKITQRVVEPNNLDKNERLKESTVDNFKLQEEVKAWKSKKNDKLYNYRTKKGISYLVEPGNEFTKLRKKNNWDEGKIKSVQMRLNNA